MPEFYGMKYPFKECARPELFKSYKTACLDCSVARFCEAPEKKYLNGGGKFIVPPKFKVIGGE